MRRREQPPPNGNLRQLERPVSAPVSRVDRLSKVRSPVACRTIVVPIEARSRFGPFLLRPIPLGLFPLRPLRWTAAVRIASGWSALAQGRSCELHRIISHSFRAFRKRTTACRTVGWAMPHSVAPHTAVPHGCADSAVARNAQVETDAFNGRSVRLQDPPDPRAGAAAQVGVASPHHSTRRVMARAAWQVARAAWQQCNGTAIARTDTCRRRAASSARWAWLRCTSMCLLGQCPPRPNSTPVGDPALAAMHCGHSRGIQEYGHGMAT